MRRVQIDPRTLRHHRRWIALAVAFAVVASAAPIVAGGSSLWFRWIAAAITVAGTIGACRFRNPIHLPMVTGLGAAALLPDDASIAPAIVAGVSAISMLLCAEAVAVARRFVTAASVESSWPDLGALATVAVGSTFAVACVAALAQLEGPGSRVLVIGVPIAATAVVAAVVGALPTADGARR